MAPVSLDVGGRQVEVTHPDKVIFPDQHGRAGHTKLDLIQYYLAVADGALRGVAGRPMILKRFVKGIDEEAVFQKRAPEKRPEWVDVAELRYASGTSAKEAVIHDAAGLAWAINLGCVDLNPHPVLADDLDHPDELRVDLDPMPGVTWRQILDVAQVAREVLEDYGLTAWPKTSGSRGFHIYAHIVPGWSFRQVRLAAQTVAREVERRAPEFTVATVPERFADIGDPWEGMDDAAAGLDGLLALAEELGPAEKAPKGARRGEDTGRRQSVMPLIEIARTKTKDEAMAALDTWRQRYPAVADRLQPADVLVDGMRGPSSIWYRIRINLQHVPDDQRPPQEELIADYSPWPTR